MKTKTFYLQTIFFLALTLTFMGCDKDFVTLDSDVINDANATNFDIVSETYGVTAYTENLGLPTDNLPNQNMVSPVETSNLPVNNLGVYSDAFGKTTSSILTQLASQNIGQDFPEDTVLDSVVLRLPLFSTITSTDEDGNFIYELDSVIGNQSIKLSLYESNYFLRDFDPDGAFSESQSYFSNKSASETEPIDESVLMGTPIPYTQKIGTTVFNTDNSNIVRISENPIVLQDSEGEITARLSPSIRLNLDNDYWNTKIVNLEDGATELSSLNNFLNYFRGLYLKAEIIDNDNESFIFLNLASSNANITLYYSSPDPDNEDQMLNDTYVFNFGPTTVNFYNNNFNSTVAPSVSDIDSENGAERILVKGGQGALGKIKLFNGGDSSAFNAFKSEFANYNDDGTFESSKRLINEANLVLYVNETEMPIASEYPERLFLYDATNNIPLIDYFLDGQSTTFPSLSIANHLGPLEKIQRNGTTQYRYKIKVTEHLNNLVLRDSSNIDLGISSSLNVNLEINNLQRASQKLINTTSDDVVLVPTSSVASPRGVILHGSNIPDNAPNNDKNIQLEIYYTCLEDDAGCN